MIILSSGRFDKDIAKLPQKIHQAYLERLRIFALNPYHRLLNNHTLTGAYRGYNSINVTGDYRAIFEQISEDTVRFIRIGTHPQLYE